MKDNEKPPTSETIPLKWKVAILLGVLALIAFWVFGPKPNPDPALGELHKNPPFNPLH